MQKDRTVNFWNQFYKDLEKQQQQNHDDNQEQNLETITNTTQQQQQQQPIVDEDKKDDHNSNNNGITTKEWILEPSPALFEFILSHLPHVETIPSDDNGNHNKKEEEENETNQICRILEIGCGNSRLAIELWQYIIQKQKRDDELDKDEQQNQNQQQQQPGVIRSNSNSRVRRIPKQIQFYATDVSEICIQQIRERDASIIAKQSSVSSTTSQQQQQQNLSETINLLTQPGHQNERLLYHHDLYNVRNNEGQFFSYNVLNILDDNHHSILMNQFDLIIDKGCLDTFLFRTKNRGNGSEYSIMIQTVLDNIQSWLKTSPTPSSLSTTISLPRSQDNDHMNETMKEHTKKIYEKKDRDRKGIYLIFSPRTKHKSVRDYNGFSSVQRLNLFDTTTTTPPIATDVQTRNEPLEEQIQKGTPQFILGELEGSRAIEQSTNHQNKKKSQNTKKKNNHEDDDIMNAVYVYICSKNDSYHNHPHEKLNHCMDKTNDGDTTMATATTQNPTNDTKNSGGCSTGTTTNDIELKRVVVAFKKRFDSTNVSSGDDDMDHNNNVHGTNNIKLTIDSTCSKCHITFGEFSNYETMTQRGTTYWYRKWSGHCQHCKAVSLS